MAAVVRLEHELVRCHDSVQECRPDAGISIVVACTAGITTAVPDVTAAFTANEPVQRCHNDRMKLQGIEDQSRCEPGSPKYIGVLRLSSLAIDVDGTAQEPVMTADIKRSMFIVYDVMFGPMKAQG